MMMNNQTDITEEVWNDEVIRYIAHRHHATVDDVVDSAMTDDCIAVNLEENEKNIIRDLIQGGIKTLTSNNH